MKMKKTVSKKRVRNFEFHILWLPFLILFFVFTILPLISSVVLSFTDFDAVSVPKFVGLDNYFRMFTGDEVLPVALKNTVLFLTRCLPLKRRSMCVMSASNIH